jgi:type II secretory pathway pseudopilin PulG
MFSLALVAMLAAAAAPDAMAQPRKAYEQCLQKLHETEIGQKAEASKFDAALSTSCAAQETALKSAIVAHYVGMKTPRKEAEQSAVDWVTDLQESAKERYRSTLAAHTPAPN